jgi:hypothetical protein
VTEVAPDELDEVLDEDEALEEVLDALELEDELEVDELALDEPEEVLPPQAASASAIKAGKTIFFIEHRRFYCYVRRPVRTGAHRSWGSSVI